MDLITLVGEASYAAGGSAGLEAKVQALAGGAGRTILAVIPQSTGGYHLEYIRSTGKLLVFYSNSDAADGVLIEVPDATVLSGVTFVLLVISQ
jgi:hypothetical protein